MVRIERTLATMVEDEVKQISEQGKVLGWSIPGLSVMMGRVCSCLTWPLRATGGYLSPCNMAGLIERLNFKSHLSLINLFFT